MRLVCFLWIRALFGFSSALNSHPLLIVAIVTLVLVDSPYRWQSPWNQIFRKICLSELQRDLYFVCSDLSARLKLKPYVSNYPIGFFFFLNKNVYKVERTWIRIISLILLFFFNRRWNYKTRRQSIGFRSLSHTQRPVLSTKYIRFYCYWNFSPPITYEITLCKFT